MLHVDLSIPVISRDPSRRGSAAAGGPARFLLLLVLCGLAAACGPAAPKGDGAASEAETARQNRSPEEAQRREETAKALYDATRQLPPDEKVGALSDLAQVYHDTAVAPLAFMDLVFYLSHVLDRPQDALAGLESFERRRPEVPELLAAANVMQSVATTKEAAAATAEERAAMAALKARALEIYTATADRLIDGPAVEDDAGSYYEIGNAYLMTGRFVEAEAAWARVESFKTPAEDARRLDLMIRRGDLLRFKLDRTKEALELFIAIRDFQEKLGRAAPTEQRDYVEAAIKALRG